MIKMRKRLQGRNEDMQCTVTLSVSEEEEAAKAAAAAAHKMHAKNFAERSK